MDNDKLADEINDVGAAIGRLNNAASALRRYHAELKERQAKLGDRQRPVTDHAVVRYLERCKGVDITAIRNELRQMADDAIAAKDGEHHWHEETGTILVIGDDAQVITVLDPEQVEKWAGRKLSNGERVPPPTQSPE